MKFKAWDSVREEWIDYADLIMEANGTVWAGDINNPPMVLIEPENVIFSSGLVDKNGEDLYDGSIIIWEIDNGVGIEHNQGFVIWSEKTEKFKNSYKWLVKYMDNYGKEQYDELGEIVNYKDSILTIGNIQEGFY